MATNETPVASAHQGEESESFKAISRGRDGTYRWVHEFNLFLNFSPVFTLWRILFAIALLLWLFMLFMSAYTRDAVFYTFEEINLFSLLFFLSFAALIVVCRWVFAALQGGRRVLVFELDDGRITSYRLKRMFGKTQASSIVGALNDAAEETAGAKSLLMSATKKTRSSHFPDVRSVKRLRLSGALKIKEPFAKHTIYVPKNDLDAMHAFIIRRCPRVRRNAQSI